MPAEFYLQTIDEVFQQFSLARGKITPIMDKKYMVY
ncbi:hypothetical protein RMONA_08560 [Rickettsia monacensis]|uniref:PHB de-polymerase C-terminal domain-containing protein n=1 Tax=Rickettsia monacensis TaxID=109232 RepID=A0A0B7J1N3_9RICK|nr:hypothetical protein RMONA_5140 [Rickettsia monacensis IrR/Munich]CEO18056.1 hypothetical protein RMONA_08560 [Rickettsia monacensis]